MFSTYWKASAVRRFLSYTMDYIWSNTRRKHTTTDLLYDVGIEFCGMKELAELSQTDAARSLTLGLKSNNQVQPANREVLSTTC